MPMPGMGGIEGPPQQPDPARPPEGPRALPDQGRTWPVPRTTVL
jgi:hypothetical protein